MIDIAQRSDSVGSVVEAKANGASRRSSDYFPQPLPENHSATSELVSFGARPTFHLAWIKTPFQGMLDFSSVDQLTLSRTQVAMVYIPDSGQPCTLEALIETFPGLSQLVVCGSEHAGQQWLPQQVDSADSLCESREFEGLAGPCEITRAFSLTSGLYAAGALAAKFGLDRSAFIALPERITLEEVLPEISAVQKTL